MDVTPRRLISSRPKSTLISIKAGFHNHSKSRPSTTSTSSTTPPLPRPSTTPQLPTSTHTRVDHSNRLFLRYPMLGVRTTTTRHTLPMVTSIGRTHLREKRDTSPGTRRANKLGRLLQTRLGPIPPRGLVKESYLRSPWQVSL